MEQPPYWLLIAVLKSTIPLEPPLAMRLYHSARELHAQEGSVEKLSGDLAIGEVRRLGRPLVIGSISGPGFEAELDTPRGSGVVRFILTRQGLGEHDDEEPSARPAASLPN